MHKDEQDHLQHTTDYRNAYIHVNMHCWRHIFLLQQLSTIEIYWSHLNLMLEQHSKMRNLPINRLLTSAFVLINVIVFNRSNGLTIKFLIADFKSLIM